MVDGTVVDGTTVGPDGAIVGKILGRAVRVV